MTSFLSIATSIWWVKFLTTSHLYGSNFLKSSRYLKTVLFVELFPQGYSLYIIRTTTSGVCVWKYMLKTKDVFSLVRAILKKKSIQPKKFHAFLWYHPWSLWKARFSLKGLFGKIMNYFTFYLSYKVWPNVI